MLTTGFPQHVDDQPNVEPRPVNTRLASWSILTEPDPGMEPRPDRFFDQPLDELLARNVELFALFFQPVLRALADPNRKLNCVYR